MLMPDSSNGSLAHTLSFSHHSSAPMSRVFWLAVQGGFHDSADFPIRNLGNPPGAGSILLESYQTKPQETLPPQLHCWARKSKHLCYFLTLHAVGGHLNYLSSLNNTRWQGSAASPSIQGLFLRWRKHDRSCSSGHAPYHTPFCIYVKIFMTHYTRGPSEQ